MASADNTKPTCPVCNQADLVKTTQAAYNAGVARCAPPDLPTRNVSMMPYIGAGMVIVGIFVFLIIVFIGGMENNLPWQFQVGLAGATITCILVALFLSFLAFQRLGRGDVETTQRFPAWDRAMNKWRSLYYCSRDEVVFDPQTRKTLSDNELAEIRNAGERVESVQRQALASH